MWEKVTSAAADNGFDQEIWTATGRPTGHVGAGWAFSEMSRRFVSDRQRAIAEDSAT